MIGSCCATCTASTGRRDSPQLATLDLGGGFGIAYRADDDPPPTSRSWPTSCARSCKRECHAAGPGRPRARRRARAGDRRPGHRHALRGRHRQGRRRSAAGARRRYVSVDGGMSDNIRTALYDADVRRAGWSRGRRRPTGGRGDALARRRKALRERRHRRARLLAARRPRPRRPARRRRHRRLLLFDVEPLQPAAAARGGRRARRPARACCCAGRPTTTCSVWRSARDRAARPASGEATKPIGVAVLGLRQRRAARSCGMLEEQRRRPRRPRRRAARAASASAVRRPHRHPELGDLLTDRRVRAGHARRTSTSSSR